MVLPTVWFVLKIFGFHLRLRPGAIDGSADSLRPADAVRLEGFASARAGEHSGHQLRGGDFMIQILFFFFAALAVGAAINVLVQKHVLYSALSLIVMLTAVSVLFILLQADFLAVINVIVYAGAIMVLFVFVIMLLNLPRGRRRRRPPALAEVHRHSAGLVPAVSDRRDAVERGTG